MVLAGATQAKCARLDLIRQINFVFLYHVALLFAKFAIYENIRKLRFFIIS